MTVYTMMVRNKLTELANILRFNKKDGKETACQLIHEVRAAALVGDMSLLTGGQKERLIYYAGEFGINLSEKLEIVEADIEPSPAFQQFLTEKRTPFGMEGSSNLADLMYEMEAEKD